MTLADMIRKAETGGQWADICAIEAQAVDLAAQHGYAPPQADQINLADDGTLASIECGVDMDGMACIVLNFSL